MKHEEIKKGEYPSLGPMLRNTLGRQVEQHWNGISNYGGLDLTEDEKYTLILLEASAKQKMICEDTDFIDQLKQLNSDEQQNKILSYSFTEKQLQELDHLCKANIGVIVKKRALREKLSANINELLREKKMSQRQLVLGLNNQGVKITASQFSKMFSPGNSTLQDPSLNVLCGIAHFFNVSLDRIVYGEESKEESALDICQFSYNDLIHLLYELEQHRYITFERHEECPLTTTGDPGDVMVTIHIHSNSDETGGDDGTIAHYLSMYTSLKKHFPDTPEGHRMVSEMNSMMLKTISDTPLFQS